MQTLHRSVIVFVLATFASFALAAPGRGRTSAPPRVSRHRRRKSAGTVTVKYTLTTATARRLRRARRRRLVLTIVPKGAPTLRKAVAISAK